MSLLAAHQASASYIPPPEPLPIRFEAGREQLTAAGEAAVDRLAVRGAQCSDGRLRVELRHAPGVAPEQVAARFKRIRQRLAGLGFEAIYVNLASKAGKAAPDMVQASVASNGDVYCWGTDSALLRHWVDEVSRHASRTHSREPAFWSRMAPAVRRDDLALTLAEAAYCQRPEGPWLSPCVMHPEVFAWLADRVGRHQAREARESWLLALWGAADDATFARWQKRLRIPELSPEARAWKLPSLVSSDLAWPDVERRLLEPGVMHAVGAWRSYRRYPGAAALVEAAAKRQQIGVLPTLIEAAGTQARAFHWELILVAGEVENDADAQRLIRLLPSGGPVFVDEAGSMTEMLLLGAYCPNFFPGRPQRYADILEFLLERGFQLDPEMVRYMTTSAMRSSDGDCRLEALPGEPQRFRRITSP
ncbi:hypothetical protein [Roseateles sp. P5_E7]